MRAYTEPALVQRRDAGTLMGRGPALMLFVRSACAVAAQAVVAVIFALRSSPTHGGTQNPGYRCTDRRSTLDASRSYGGSRVARASVPSSSSASNSRAWGAMYGSASRSSRWASPLFSAASMRPAGWCTEPLRRRTCLGRCRCRRLRDRRRGLVIPACRDAVDVR
jgi:hypothetical protein